MGLFSRKSKEGQPKEQAPPEAQQEAGVHLSVDELKLSGDADGMLDLLANGSDADQRAEAAWALVELKDGRVVDALVAIVQNGSEDVHLRFQSIGALGKLHGPQAVQPLITVLSDHAEEVHVRTGAAVSLGWIGDTRAAEPLAEVWLKAEDATLKDKAGVAFRELGVGGSDVLVAALADPQACGEAAELLATFADRSVIPNLRAAVEQARAAKEKKAAKAAEEAIKAIEHRAA